MYITICLELPENPAGQYKIGEHHLRDCEILEYHVRQRKSRHHAVVH